MVVFKRNKLLVGSSSTKICLVFSAVIIQPLNIFLGKKYYLYVLLCYAISFGYWKSNFSLTGWLVRSLVRHFLLLTELLLQLCCTLSAHLNVQEAREAQEAV